MVPSDRSSSKKTRRIGTPVGAFRKSDGSIDDDAQFHRASRIGKEPLSKEGAGNEKKKDSKRGRKLPCTSPLELSGVGSFGGGLFCSPAVPGFFSARYLRLSLLNSRFFGL